MINFKKKLYIVTGLLTLSAGQFFAVASDDESEELKKDSYAMPQQTPEATQNTLVDNTTDFLPKILGRDTQNCLATYMLEIEDPCTLAQLSKPWYAFLMGGALVPKEKDKISAIPFPENSRAAKWFEKRDLKTLNSGIFFCSPGCYLPGQPVFKRELSTMADTNGDLVLPSEMAEIPLCVTRNVETFVNPTGKNARKVIILILTLNELKGVAQNISDNTDFIHYVKRANLLKDNAAFLIRNGRDNLSESGFSIKISNFQKIYYIEALHRNAKVVALRPMYLTLDVWAILGQICKGTCVFNFLM